MSDNTSDSSNSNSNIPSNANQGCVGPESEQAGKASACDGCPNQTACATGAAKQVDPAVYDVAANLATVKNIVLVLSGKGGVGKSTVSSQIAWRLSDMGKEVGILDIDICGPSIPRMMGVENEDIHPSGSGWSPVYAADNLAVMSVGFMLTNRNDAIIWRGPRKNGLIKQFLTDVNWGDLDYLIIDAPPGTSDEHLSIVQYLKNANVRGAVIVTTPQEISLLDVRKEVSFCLKTKIPVLGVVENMSGFVCPCCKTKSEIFPPVSGGASQMATDMKVPFLGGIPLDPKLLTACEQGKSYVANVPDGTAVPAIKSIVDALIEKMDASIDIDTNDNQASTDLMSGDNEEDAAAE